MPSFVVPANGDLAVAEHVAQVVEDFQGLRNIPISLTGINDAASYGFTVKNVGAGSKDLICYAADGTTVLFQVDSSGVQASSSGGAASGIVTLTGTQTLTSKTLTSPHMTDPVVDSGNLTLTAGALVFGAASSQVIPGTGSLSFRNNANSADNLIIANAGGVVARLSLAAPTVHAGVGGINSNNGLEAQFGAGSTNFPLFCMNAAGTPVITARADGLINIAVPGAFVAGDRYLVIDASGNVHRSALSPAS
jgi:hypothetical protein